MIFKLLADENFSFAGYTGPHRRGLRCSFYCKNFPGINDRAVLSLACETGRSLHTFDVDFGDLVFSHGVELPIAVLFFRLHPIIVEELLTIILCALNEVQPGYFVVISREGMRLRKL